MTGRCYILANVAEHLWKQIKDLEHVSDMVQTLDRMIVESSSTFRQAVIGALIA